MPATRSSSAHTRSHSTRTSLGSTSGVQLDIDSKGAIADLHGSAALDELADGDILDFRGKKKKRLSDWERNERIPRPRNAFISFKASLRNGPLQNEYNARLARGENIGVIAQQLWKSLKPKERDAWYAAARKEKEEHAKKYPDYKYQPRQKTRKTSKNKGRRNGEIARDDQSEGDGEPEGEGENEGEPEEHDHSEETTGTSESPSSIPSDLGEAYGSGLRRTVEIYLGGTEDLELLYQNGWKWALIRECNPSLDVLPVVEEQHASDSLALVQPEGPSPSDDAAGLSIDMITMGSAMANTTGTSSTATSLNLCSTADPSIFQQYFGPWDSSAPQSTFFEDTLISDSAPPFDNSMLKVPSSGMETCT